MKNVVFIPNINLGDGRNNSYNYSIKSWKYWCDKKNEGRRFHVEITGKKVNCTQLIFKIRNKIIRLLVR